MSVKTALVLSAGGMFGAYQAGAWKELSQYFQPDMVVGTSVGALNGWTIAGGIAPDELLRWWSNESVAAFLRPQIPLLPWRGFFDHHSFRKNVQELFERFKPGIPFGVVLAEALRLRPRLVQSEQVTWRHLAAACAIPAGLPPVRIDGTWYVDGGVLTALPLWAAATMGAMQVIAVNALPVLPSTLLRAGANAIRWISPKAPSRDGLDVITIAPPDSLGSVSESVRWNRDNIRRWMERGAEDARRVIPQLSSRDWRAPVLQ
jgi:NTE family protein